MREHTLSKKKTVHKARMLATGVVAFGLLFSQTAAHAAPLETAPNSFQKSTPVTEIKPFTSIDRSVTASKDVKITFASPVVKSTPAAKKVEPVAVAEEAVTAPVDSTIAQDATATSPAPVAGYTQAYNVAPQANTPAQKTNAVQAPSAPVAPAPAPAASTAPIGNSGSSKGSQIAAAALAQLGVQQDCTALASNSLRAVGINFHDWPAGYFSLGTVTNSPLPGDLIYYRDGGGGQAHVAVYIGNHQAVHGGWNGNQTAIFSVNVGSGPVYIRVA